MQGPLRRVVYVALYEFIAIVVTTGFMMLVGQSGGDSLFASVVVSVTAIVWNLVFNWFFERWERRQPTKGRGVGRRIAHAIGFEGGLMLFIVPFFALWFGITLWEAFLLEAGILVFFLFYTFAFTWAFDRVFGLPASARPEASAEPEAAAE